MLTYYLPIHVSSYCLPVYVSAYYLPSQAYQVFRCHGIGYSSRMRAHTHLRAHTHTHTHEHTHTPTPTHTPELRSSSTGSKGMEKRSKAVGDPGDE